MGRAAADNRSRPNRLAGLTRLCRAKAVQSASIAALRATRLQCRRLSFGRATPVFFLGKENGGRITCSAAGAASPRHHAAKNFAPVRKSPRAPVGAKKEAALSGCRLFYFSQMTGFWRSDSTKALAFSTASARGSLTCSPVRMFLQDTTPAAISSSPRK